MPILWDGWRRLPGLSSFPLPHPGIVPDVPGRLTSGSSLAARGRGDACRRNLGNRPRSRSWLFQSPLPGGEGLWELASRDGVHAGGDGYQFDALCFGLSTAPQVGTTDFISVGSLARDPTPPVSGRLVGSCLLGAGSQTDGPVPSLALSHPRDCDKREEV